MYKNCCGNLKNPDLMTFASGRDKRPSHHSLKMFKKPNWFSTSSIPEKHFSAMLQVLASRESARLTAREVCRLRVHENLVPTSYAQAAILLQQGVTSELVEHYSIAIGVNKDNIASNRYLDVVPYDRTRVIVQWPSTDAKTDKEGDRNGRYLNANWVLEREGKKWWIATQAPLGHTAHAFLSLMLQPNACPPPTLLSSHSHNTCCVQAPTKTSRVRTVVQLTQNTENGRKKADSYFPSDVGSSFLIPPEAGCDAPALKVTLLATKSIEHAHCIQSTVSIVPRSRPLGRDVVWGDGYNHATDDEVIFQHLLYTSWPDHGVPNPEDRASLLAFIQLVESTNRADISLYTIHPGTSLELDPDPPIIIGCSAGIGRTGSFIALSSLLRASGFLPPALRPTPSSVLPASPLSPLPIDAINDRVIQEIDSLREQRPGMVQRKEQVALVYERYSPKVDLLTNLWVCMTSSLYFSHRTSLTMSNFPPTIEAITIPSVGGIEIIQKTTIPFPKVNPGDIVVKVDYFGVNFIDTYFRSGLYKFNALPAVLGKEAAGTIVALPTDPNVLNNETFKKQGFAVGGKVATDFLGSHATYISVPWKCVYPVPASISTQIAAAALLQGLTAVSFFEEAYKVKQGDTILVHTVAGGLGLLFAQLGRRVGATVIGTTSTQAKADLAKANGADHVILYPVEDTVKRVLELTNNEGVDAVFDGVGKDTFDNNFKMIKRKGTIVSVGNASGAVEPFSLPKLVEKNVKLLRPTMANYVFTAEEAAHYGKEVFELIEKNELKIKVFKEYPFSAEGVQSAQRDLTGGKTTGKLLIKVA